jgi:hypothetical protein
MDPRPDVMDQEFWSTNHAVNLPVDEVFTVVPHYRFIPDRIFDSMMDYVQGQLARDAQFN